MNISAYSATNIATKPIDVIAYLDSATGGHIFLPVDRFNNTFKSVTTSRGIVIEGVDESAAQIPVQYTATHAILGYCHLAQIRNRLISIPKLLKKEFSMTGRKNSIIIDDRDGKTMFASIPDEKGLYPHEAHQDIRTSHATCIRRHADLCLSRDRSQCQPKKFNAHIR